MNESKIRIRHGVRVILLDPDDRLLMLHVIDPSVSHGLNPIPSDFWIPVGGGIEEGETPIDAARREVFEESGIRDIKIGPWLWYRERLVTWADAPIRATERYYLARVPTGTAVTFDNHTVEERAVIKEYRWWTQPEILAASSTQTMLPPGIGALLGALLRDGPPDEPLVLPGS